MEEDTETEMSAMRRQLQGGGQLSQDAGLAKPRQCVTVCNQSQSSAGERSRQWTAPASRRITPVSQTNAHAQTDAVCSKLLRFSASKHEWRWLEWRPEIKSRRVTNLALGTRMVKLLMVFMYHQSNGRIIWMLCKIVSFKACFNVCAVEVDAGFIWSDKSHLCSREQERGRNVAGTRRHLRRVFTRNTCKGGSDESNSSTEVCRQ